MLIHTCEIDKLAQGVATSASYGHNRILPSSNTTPEHTYTKVQGRMVPLSAIEMQMQQTQGQVTADFHYYVINFDIVSELRTNMTASVKYQLKNIRDKAGNILRAGPYDINEIVDETGEGHHWRILLRRVA